MPLLLIPILLGAIAYGAYRLYASVAMRLGPLAGIAALVLAAAVVVAVAAYFVHRHRLIHGKTVNGRRILELPGSWGRLTLDANRKQGSLSLHDLTAQFIFADIAGVASIERRHAGPGTALAPCLAARMAHPLVRRQTGAPLGADPYTGRATETLTIRRDSTSLRKNHMLVEFLLEKFSRDKKIK